MQTEYEFTLPKGFLDENGVLHRRGKMRLATAEDEIGATRDPRVLSNPSYLTVALLSRVITQLEDYNMITGTTIGQFFTADLAFLQDMYQKINDVEPPVIRVVCPKCGEEIETPVNFTVEG